MKKDKKPDWIVLDMGVLDNEVIICDGWDSAISLVTNVFDCSEDDRRDKLEAIHDVKDNSRGAVFADEDRGSVLLVVKSTMDKQQRHLTAIHESVHAGLFLMENIGQSITSSDELLPRVIQSIVKAYDENFL